MSATSWNEVERHRVHAVAQSGRPRSVAEDVPEMRVAAGAADGRAQHAEAVAGTFDDIEARDRLPETRPAGAGVELRLRIEECGVAADAAIEAVARIPCRTCRRRAARFPTAASRRRSPATGACCHSSSVLTTRATVTWPSLAPAAEKFSMVDGAAARRARRRRSDSGPVVAGDAGDRPRAYSGETACGSGGDHVHGALRSTEGECKRLRRRRRGIRW